MLRSVLLVILAVYSPFLASCSARWIPEGMLPKAAERKESLAKHREAWKSQESVKDFGLERSIAVVDREKTTGETMAPIGMAAFVTADGYALTANHVVEEGSELGVLAAAQGVNLVPVHIGTARMTIKGVDGRVKKEVDWVGYGGYSIYRNGKEQKVQVADVKVGALRVVKRFPSLDLALIQCEVKPTGMFKMASSPADGATLFASGNPFRYRASAAGEVTKVSAGRSGGASIHTSIPLSPGDSGSPVFDGRGRLVGIVTDGFPKGVFGFSPSIARRIDSRQLDEAISSDRAERRDR